MALLFVLFYFSNFSCSFIQKKHKKTDLNFTITVFGDPQLIKNEILFTKRYFQNFGIEIGDVFYRKGFMEESDIVINDLYIDKIQKEKTKSIGINVFLVNSITKKGKKNNKFSGFSIKNDFDKCSPIILLSTQKMKKNTLVHEIGHIFDLKHSKESTNIMFYKANDNKFQIKKEQLFTIKQKLLIYKFYCGSIF